MAISYLSNIDLNNNQLKSFAVDNITGASDPASGSSVAGRLIYRTSLNVLKFYNGTNWIALDGSIYSWNAKGDTGSQSVASGVTVDFIGSQGISTAVSLDGAVVKNTITIDNTATDLTGQTFTNATITVDRQGRLITAGSGGSPILSFDVEGNGANSQSITNGVTVDFVSNTGLTIVTSSVDATNKAATINLALEDLPDMTQSWATVDEFIVLDGTEQKRKAGNEIPINLLGTPAASLAMGSNKITGLLAGTANTDAVNLQQLNNAVVGSLQIKGGFNADTGVIDGGTTNLTKNDQPATGDETVAIAVGDFYVCTFVGNFFGNAATPLTVGDQVICNTAAAAGDSVESDFVIVQSDTDLATATAPGIASFPVGGGLTVSSGVVSIDAQTSNGIFGGVTKALSTTINTDGIVTAMSDADIAIPSTQITDFCTAVQSCVGTNLNFSANIGDGTTNPITVTHSLNTKDIIVQLFDIATGDTVYCDVKRDSLTTVEIGTTTALPAVSGTPVTVGTRLLISVV